jgi:hypothetical protein
MDIPVSPIAGGTGYKPPARRIGNHSDGSIKRGKLQGGILGRKG